MKATDRNFVDMVTNELEMDMKLEADGKCNFGTSMMSWLMTKSYLHDR